MADLRQILSQGRKQIGILIGAGAALSVRVNDKGNICKSGYPIIPGVEALTDLSLKKLGGDEATAANAIRSHLPDGGNIETILSKVRLLETAIGENKVHGLDANGYKELGVKICAAIGDLVGAQLPPQRTPYHELIAWIGGTQRPNAIEIFTTNYDLLLEEAFELAKAPYYDGFSGGRLPFFDPASVSSSDLPARWSRLWKLHGSLGWKLIEDSVVRTGGSDCNELVYPDHLKYDLTQKQPYSALFERLKQFLMTPDTLLMTIGFSYRDAHINAVLDEALAANSNTAAIAFQFQKISEETAACELAYKRPNLSVYTADAAIISGVEGYWQPGDPPKNWDEIRSSFWGKIDEKDENQFLLGDFSSFARFCALSNSEELVRSDEGISPGNLDLKSAEILQDNDE